MATEVISTIKPKNNGSFPVVEAADVAVDEDTRLDAALLARPPVETVTALPAEPDAGTLYFIVEEGST